jgi:hypothetical protein
MIDSEKGYLECSTKMHFARELFHPSSKYAVIFSLWKGLYSSSEIDEGLRWCQIGKYARVE